MENKNGIVELTSEELKTINGGQKEWLLLFWGAGLIWGALATGIYFGYNEEMSS